jgi:hypothetical protein
MLRPRYTHTNLITAEGVFEIENTGHTLTKAPEDFATSIGKQVYIAGKRIIDVATVSPIPGTTMIIRQTEVN